MNDRLSFPDLPEARPDPTRSGWLRWVLLFGFWTLPGLLSAGYVYLFFSMEEQYLPFWRAAAWHMPLWYFWAVLTPAILWIARRLAFERKRWVLSLLGHLLVVVVAIALHSAVSIPFTLWFAPAPFATWDLQMLFIYYATRTAALDLVTYGGIIGLGYAFDFYRKYQDRELQTSQLQAELAQAQLQALKMQLHPHFLFNTLHAISVLVRKGAHQQAIKMLAGISDLLRVALDNVGTQELSLKQELEFLERYLELEQIRFQDRLQVEMEIEPETLDAQVPNLILQPLVENAIRHGIAATASGGLLRIRAHCEEEKLCVEIRDNGPGLSFSRNPEGEGVGLSNTRKRLNRLYGERHRFTVENGEDGGAVAFLEIPLRYAH